MDISLLYPAAFRLPLPGPSFHYEHHRPPAFRLGRHPGPYRGSIRISRALCRSPVPLEQDQSLPSRMERRRGLDLLCWRGPGHGRDIHVRIGDSLVGHERALGGGKRMGKDRLSRHIIRRLDPRVPVGRDGRRGEDSQAQEQDEEKESLTICSLAPDPGHPPSTE
jgi:hypothetical protein